MSILKVARMGHPILRAKALNEELRKKVLAELDLLPDGESVCHGDFHPENVLISSKGTAIIDWNDAVQGNPVADVARTTLLLRITSIPSGALARCIIRLSRSLFLTFYLRRYFTLQKVDHGELQAWMPVVAAARLSEGIAEEEEQLLAITRAG